MDKQDRMERQEICLLGRAPDSMLGQVYSSSGMFSDVVRYLCERHGEDVVPDDFLGALATGLDGELSAQAAQVLSRRVTDWINIGTARYLAWYCDEALTDYSGEGWEWVWTNEEVYRFARFLKHSGGVSVVSKKPESKKRRR